MQRRRRVLPGLLLVAGAGTILMLGLTAAILDRPGPAPSDGRGIVVDAFRGSLDANYSPEDPARAPRFAPLRQDAVRRHRSAPDL